MAEKLKWAIAEGVKVRAVRSSMCLRMVVEKAESWSRGAGNDAGRIDSA